MSYPTSLEHATAARPTSDRERRALALLHRLRAGTTLCRRCTTLAATVVSMTTRAGVPLCRSCATYEGKLSPDQRRARRLAEVR